MVGGGISGLAAAYFFQQQHGADKKILILDNHDDFGGHAKRNEHVISGNTYISYGGSQSIVEPKYADQVVLDMFEDIGIDLKRFSSAYDLDFYQRHGLGGVTYFNKEVFGPLWESLYNDEWKSPNFWYINDDINYGPKHEIMIRNKIIQSNNNLSNLWEDKFFFHDSINRRDDGARAQIRAEIDAYTAHLYNLDRKDFEFIINSFRVLKKNEEKDFGEFQTKRKCLEEFDRINKFI